ncbi:MAG: autotransporter-associated beta strand repeat-containing protein [Chthoniobacterales bacterium]|nr:autotransporter-associated beta strand repeat-containing protein [Chthoniobacterales bacterium]
MNKKNKTPVASAVLRLIHRAFTAASGPALLLLLSTSPSDAGSATWKLNPSSSDWNTAANWTPETVPDGESDTATFDVSDLTDISLSAFTVLDGIVFNSGANAFTINTKSNIIEIFGDGIINNSGVTQKFVVPIFNIGFFNQAAAGSSTVFIMKGGFLGSAAVGFADHSSAGSGTFIMLGATTGETQGGNVVFTNSSTAADGTFVARGASVEGAFGGFILFEDSSDAGNAIIVNNDTLVRGGGGCTAFLDNSSGGKARIKVLGQGELDITFHDSPGVTTGSIEGSGLVILGANTLSVGKNDLDTTFSGVIQDGQTSETGGALTKIGKGGLTLTNANTYTGGTTIDGGTLVVNNSNGSGTGSGAVQLNAGSLEGRGIISGAVFVGNGSGLGAILSPGRAGSRIHTLTVQSALTFNSNATYRFELNSNSGRADEVVAKGVTINSGALFSFSDRGTGTLFPGTVFVVIDNTAATSIAGTFTNLTDGSTFSAGANSFQVSYHGGTGNDLTLTVVP